MATKPRGGVGLEALVAGPLRKELFFCGFPLETRRTYNNTNINFIIKFLFDKIRDPKCKKSLERSMSMQFNIAFTTNSDIHL